MGVGARRQRQSDWGQRGLPGGPEGELHGCAGVCWFPRGARSGETCGSGAVKTKTNFTTEGTEKPLSFRNEVGSLVKRETVSCASSSALTDVVEVGIEKRKHSGSLITATKLSEPLIADARLFLGVARGEGA